MWSWCKRSREPKVILLQAERSVRFAATLYDPIDAVADCENRKAGAKDRTGGTVVTLIIIVPALAILVLSHG
jgi:hypothetical protein